MSIYFGNQRIGANSLNTASPIGLTDIGQHTFASGIVNYQGDRLWPYAFNKMNITEIHAPNLIAFTDSGSAATAGVGSYVFAGCTNLEVVDLPNLLRTGSGGYQFSGCINLESIFLPKAFVGTYMFSGCTKLKTAVFPHIGISASQMNGNGFRGCSVLESVDIKTSRVYTNEFYNCAKMDILVLRNTAMATLSNVNAFTGTPFASGKAGGTLYVPASLVDTYAAGTNWVTILGYGDGAQNSIKSIESTHTDPTAPIDLTLYYADRTLIT